jgi:hypothetical protein
VFLPLYAKGHTGNAADRTGIYSAPAEAAVAASMRVVASHPAPRAIPSPYRAGPWMRARVEDNLRRARERRMPVAEGIEPPPAIPPLPNRSDPLSFGGNSHAAAADCACFGNCEAGIRRTAFRFPGTVSFRSQLRTSVQAGR